jgi:dienelactone hydrolase
MYKKVFFVFCLIITITACAPQNQPELQTEPTLAASQPTQSAPQIIPTVTSKPVLPTATPIPLSTASPIPLPPVSEEYLPYTIDYLRSRSYGGGQIEMLDVMEERERFTRYLIRYPSDGLDIYGFVDIPNKGDGPFPVMVVIHGYVELGEYETLDYTTAAADLFANNGYLVLHPNMRGYPPSDAGDNLYRVGLAVDILNLIALVKEQGNQPGWLGSADPARIGMWGHSLGGEVALRVATVSNDLKAVLLYAAASGDEHKNADLLYSFTGEQTLLTELETPSDVMTYISPLYHFDNITAPVRLYHGTADLVVPLDWAEETCDVMQENSVDVDCVYYTDGGHLFFSKFQPEFDNSVLAFFASYLMTP